MTDMMEVETCPTGLHNMGRRQTGERGRGEELQLLGRSNLLRILGWGVTKRKEERRGEKGEGKGEKGRREDKRKTEKRKERESTGTWGQLERDVTWRIRFVLLFYFFRNISRSYFCGNAHNPVENGKSIKCRRKSLKSRGVKFLIKKAEWDPTQR